MSWIACQKAQLIIGRPPNFDFLLVGRPSPLSLRNAQSRKSLCFPVSKYRSLHQLHYHGNTDVQTRSKSDFLEQYKTSLAFPEQTHQLRELLRSHIGSSNEQKIVIHGYLGARRDQSKKLSFVPLSDRDLRDEIQVISLLNSTHTKNSTVHERLKQIRPQTPVAVTGLLRIRPDANRNNSDQSCDEKSLKDYEVILQDIQCLNDYPSDVIMQSDTGFPPEQRHLQIRTDRHISQALILRDSISRLCIEELNGQHGFNAIETPLLFKSTSEGAREFIVPTRRKGLAYALPQSPQQFKQILMASGISRYYQFARCFRDEDLRADRQPEFTQLDLEMSFANGEAVMKIIEKLVRRLWNDMLALKLPEPFPQMTYQHAMSKYGSDKPDLRIPIKPFNQLEALLPVDLISKITPLNDWEVLVDSMVVPLKTSPEAARRFIGNFLDSSSNKHFLENSDGGPGIFVYDSSKPLHGMSAFGFAAVEHIERELDLEDGHIIVLQARKRQTLSGGATPLGDLRTALYRAAVAEGLLDAPSWTDFAPLWVVEFPLFSSYDASEPGQGGNAGLASTHHPFTSPKSAEDVDLLLSEPTRAVGDHYDLVINGEEIGGGSRRIHNAEMQAFIFRNVLRMDEERISEFSHLLEALKSGCPPHAGIALGFDRLVAMIHSSKTQRKTSLRDVIAFPKSGKGDDLMVKSPGTISKEVLDTYHLELKE